MSIKFKDQVKITKGFHEGIMVFVANEILSSNQGVSFNPPLYDIQLDYEGGNVLVKNLTIDQFEVHIQ